MTNHARTLLLNQPATARKPPTYFAEEYVPPDYVPVALPIFLRDIQGVLFGRQADRALRNFRLRQYMTVLHESELADYVTELDPRITYTIGNDSLLDVVGRLTLSGVDPQQVTLLGDPPEPADNRLHYAWDISRTGDTCHVQMITPLPQATVAALEFVAGLSQAIPLPLSSLTVRLSEQADDGGLWQVSYLAAPLLDLGVIVNLLAGLSPGTLQTLFGGAREEPYKTFFNAAQTAQLPLRLSGYLLATAWRTEALRTHG